MRALIFIGLVVGFCFASGGDTIKYTADVKNLKDGDNFYSDIHYHSMKDSIAAIVNGKLGNINIAADAEIDLSKLDTAGNMKFNTLTTDKHTSDTIIVDTMKIRSLNSDSATIPVFKGAKTIRDTSTFTGGAYFAGIARFAGTLYAPVVDIDSLAGTIKVGDGAVISNYCYAKNSTADGTYIGIFKGQGSLPGYPTNYYPTLKTDGNALYFSAFERYLGAISFNTSTKSSGFLLYDSTSGTYTVYINSKGPSYINGSLKVQACTTSTLNTDSIKINGGSWLNTYVTGTFACTLKTSDVTVQQIGTAYYTKVGNKITISMPKLTGTSNSTTLKIYCRVPYLPIQSDGSNKTNKTVISILDDGIEKVGYVQVFNEGIFRYWYCHVYEGFTASGTKGFETPFTVQYITEN